MFRHSLGRRILLLMLIVSLAPVIVITIASRDYSLVSLSIILLVAVMIAAVYWFVRKTIVMPIQELAKNAVALSNGNFDARVITHRRDELGSLATVFNNLAESLLTMVTKASAEGQKSRVLLNNVNEGILALGVNGSIVLANLAASDMVGDLPKNVTHAQFDSLFKFSLNNQPYSLKLSEMGIYKELMLTNPAGRVYYVDVLVNPIIHDPSGIQTILTIFNRTEERQLENMKVDFVSMAAHELRTPMTAIRGYVDLMRHDPSVSMPPQFDEYVGHIEASANELVSLINNLLNVSRIERGALTLNFSKQPLAGLVQDSVSNLSFAAHSKKISLNYSGPSDDCPVLADKLAITEVVNNLINNAINFTPEGGSIEVSLTELATGFELDVRDTGVGIPQSSLNYLFTKFFRAKSGNASGSGGTGLGLFISKNIIELHKGTIRASSKEGSGSTFSVFLPRFSDEAYDKLNIKEANIKQRHGWVIKNPTR